MKKLMSDRTKEILIAKPSLSWDEERAGASGIKFHFNFGQKMNFQFSQLLEDRLLSVLKIRFQIDFDSKTKQKYNLLSFGPVQICF